MKSIFYQILEVLSYNRLYREPFVKFKQLNNKLDSSVYQQHFLIIKTLD